MNVPETIILPDDVDYFISDKLDWFKKWCPEGFKPYNASPIPNDDHNLFVFAVNKDDQVIWYVCPKTEVRHCHHPRRSL